MSAEDPRRQLDRSPVRRQRVAGGRPFAMPWRDPIPFIEIENGSTGDFEIRFVDPR